MRRHGDKVRDASVSICLCYFLANYTLNKNTDWIKRLAKYFFVLRCQDQLPIPSERVPCKGGGLLRTVLPALPGQKPVRHSPPTHERDPHLRQGWSMNECDRHLTQPDNSTAVHGQSAMSPPSRASDEKETTFLNVMLRPLPQGVSLPQNTAPGMSSCTGCIHSFNGVHSGAPAVRTPHWASRESDTPIKGLILYDLASLSFSLLVCNT